MSFLTSYNDYECTIIPGSVHEKVCLVCEQKNGAILWLYRVHVSLFKEHNFHGIANCCKTVCSTHSNSVSHHWKRTYYFTLKLVTATLKLNKIDAMQLVFCT